MIEANGFDMEIGYGGLDRAVGYRLVNPGIRGVRVRHRLWKAPLRDLRVR